MVKGRGSWVQKFASEITDGQNSEESRGCPVLPTEPPIGYTTAMFHPITRLGTTTRWSDATVHRGVAYVVEVPARLPADAQDQVRQVLSQLEETLLRVGGSKEKMLMCTIYLADMADRETFNEVWDAWLVPGTAPVRACVQVGLADPAYKVEIQAVAAV